MNIPTPALQRPKGVKVVPMGVERYGEHFEKRTDPRGRNYYWATGDPPPRRGTRRDRFDGAGKRLCDIDAAGFRPDPARHARRHAELGFEA